MRYRKLCWLPSIVLAGCMTTQQVREAESRLDVTEAAVLACYDSFSGAVDDSAVEKADASLVAYAASVGASSAAQKQAELIRKSFATHLEQRRRDTEPWSSALVTFAKGQMKAHFKNARKLLGAL